MNMQKKIKIDDIDGNCDIQIDAKIGQIVMILANAEGRPLVEKLFPSVEWTTDDVFRLAHSDDWLFTHVRITSLQPHFAAKTALELCVPDAVGFAVAMALQSLAKRRRIVQWVGSGADVQMRVYDTKYAKPQSEADLQITGEYMPPGTITVSERPSVH